MGSVDSPFLAINTVHHHLENVTKTHPKLSRAAKFIKDHLYVDDLLGAVDSIDEAIERESLYCNLLGYIKTSKTNPLVGMTNYQKTSKTVG